MDKQSRPRTKEQVERAKLAVKRIHALRERLAAEGKLDGLNVRELIDEGRKI